MNDSDLVALDRLRKYGYTWSPSDEKGLDLFVCVRPAFQISLLFPSGPDPQVDFSNPRSLTAALNGVLIRCLQVGDRSKQLETANREASLYAASYGYESMAGPFVASRGPLMSFQFRSRENLTDWPVWVYFPDPDDNESMWLIQQGKNVSSLTFRQVVDSFEFVDVDGAMEDLRHGLA